MARWVCVVRPPEPNDIRSESELQHRTTAQIAALLPEKYSGGYLAVRTPRYRLRLKPGCTVLAEYPDLL
jgi:hypothetical protein